MSQSSANLILVDDDPQMRGVLTEFLTGSGHDVREFESAQEVVVAINKDSLNFKNAGPVNAVITDLRMPEMSGIDLIQNLKVTVPEVPVILITAHGSIDSAIEATRLGAFDYIVKPFKLNEFEVSLNRAIEHGKLARENKDLREQLKNNGTSASIIGKSSAMKSVFSLIDRVAKASANVLVNGESGTGKELVAKSIHDKSKRSDKEFVAINCSAIPENLLESELFGHVKGAFTGAIADKKGLFEEAHKSTLFLDEIGDLNLGLQAKILRAIQEKEIKPVGSAKSRKVDVRIIAATHKNLREECKAGNFREDLYFRLSVIPISLPSLAARKEDIPLLVHHFLNKFADQNGNTAKSISPSALSKIINTKWEGNVRELENFIERTVILCDKSKIELDDLTFEFSEGGEKILQDSLADWPTLDELERRYIQAVLDKVDGKKERAAGILGINRRTLYRKEIEYSSH